MDKLRGGEVVREDFLGQGIVVQRLDHELLLVLWDRTPPVDYNTGVNPSVVFERQLKRVPTG
jgi:hypothetical protein